jgi:transposase
MDSAVRMVLDIRRQDPARAGVVGTVGDLMGIHPEVLRHWVRKAEPEPAPAPVPLPAAKAQAAVGGAERIESLERENADLRRTCEVLKAAALLFASELQQVPAG